MKYIKKYKEFINEDLYYVNNHKKYKHVYYALLDKEILNKLLIYKHDPKYDGKGVNLTLDGLQKFLKDNFEYDLQTMYYIKIPISFFKIKQNILFDNKYDMITVETPFTINLKKYRIKKLYKDS